MGMHEPIHKISMQLGLTSRTLRYWEDMGLFCSTRDLQSGWRVYDAEAVQRIRLTLLLRELNIPIKAVKAILDSTMPQFAAKIIALEMDELDQERVAITQRKDVLGKCISALDSLYPLPDASRNLANIENALAHQLSSVQNCAINQEDILMSHDPNKQESLHIIALPPMRVAVCTIVSDSPEDEALNRVLEWASSQDLMGTARIFGMNTTSYTPGCTEYGWAACITIPEHVALPDHLEEKRLSGGLYAMTMADSTSAIYDSWQTLVKKLDQSHEYQLDHDGRPCLEEHIQRGDSNSFYVNLLEPIRKK
jgi:DNA-binding transcriptional MerR regulator/DNA gyrase inhibitor GyrI